MSKSIKVLLSFIPQRLQKLRDYGAENGWVTSKGTLKNAAIAMNIINFHLQLRNDPIFNQIIKKEGILPQTLIVRELNRYAAQKGYGIIQPQKKRA